MGKEKRAVMVCDNPNCGDEFITSAAEPAVGYYLGKGTWVSSMGGGPIPAAFACSEDCIAPAVIELIEEAGQ